MSEDGFLKSTPRKIMLFLMYQGIENGVLTTKQQHRQKMIEQQDKWDKLSPVRDMRSVINGG